VKEHANLNTILDLFESEISKNVKNKHKVYMFEKNKFQNINHIINVLQSGNYNGGKYNIFLIKEPKHRIVMALDISDKIINHFIARYVLEKKLTKYLDPRNIATRKNMGTDCGIKMLKKYLELNKKYGEFYIAKLDISKYFYSIDHEVLKELVRNKLDENEYKFLCLIIDSTNREYINLKIQDIKDKYLDKHPKFEKEMNAIPFYNYGKGLPIGNMTSQFLSIFYLYELDHYIVHNLHIKHYIRYMDDFVLIHHDKKVLENAVKEIEFILSNKYKLKLNSKKTKIVSASEGFSFLGYTYKVINKKTIVKLRKESYERIKKRIKEVYYMYESGFIDFNSAFCSVMSYWYNRKYGSQMKVRRVINRYWFDRVHNGIQK